MLPPFADERQGPFLTSLRPQSSKEHHTYDTLACLWALLFRRSMKYYENGTIAHANKADHETPNEMATTEEIVAKRVG